MLSIITNMKNFFDEHGGKIFCDFQKPCNFTFLLHLNHLDDKYRIT
jgi:hypothetical protein